MHRIIIRSVGSNAAVTWYEQNAGVRSQGDLARPYADFPNGEVTPSSPSPLQAHSPSGAQVEQAQVHCDSPCSPCAFTEAWRAGPGGCCALRNQVGSHRLDPRSRALLGWGAAFSAPLPPGPQWSFSGSSCGAEKGETDDPCLGRAREAEGSEGLCTGNEVPFERHCRSLA